MHRQYYQENKQKGLGQAKAEQTDTQTHSLTHTQAKELALNLGGDEYFRVLSTVGWVTDTVSRRAGTGYTGGAFHDI